MKRTFNRAPLSVRTPSSNDIGEYSLNLTNWKGLSDNENFLTASPESFEDCNNVYVNMNGALRSRPSVKKSPITLGSYTIDSLKNIWSFGQNIIYLDVDNNLYITNHGNVIGGPLQMQTDQMKIACYENLLVIFLSNDIKIFDLNSFEFKKLDDVIYAPISNDDYEESPNELGGSERLTGHYNNDDPLDLDFYDKDLTYTIGDKEYTFRLRTDIDTLNFLRPLYSYKSGTTSNYLVANGKVIFESSADNRWHLIYNGEVSTIPTLPNSPYNVDKLVISSTGDSLIYVYAYEKKLRYDDITEPTPYDYVYAMAMARLNLDEPRGWVVQTLSEDMDIPELNDATDTSILGPRGELGQLYVYAYDYNNVMIVADRSTCIIFKDGNEHRCAFHTGLARFGQCLVYPDSLGVLHFVSLIVYNPYPDDDTIRIALAEVYSDEYASYYLSSIVNLYTGTFTSVWLDSFQLYYSDLKYVNGNVYMVYEYYNKRYEDGWNSCIDYFEGDSVNDLTNLSIKHLDVPESLIKFDRAEPTIAYARNTLYLVSKENMFILKGNTFVLYDFVFKTPQVNGDDYSNISTDGNYIYLRVFDGENSFIATNNISEPLEFYATEYGNLRTFYPDVLYTDDVMFMCNDKTIRISEKRYDSDGNLKLYFPKYNTNIFQSDITALHPLSETQLGVFFEDSVYVINYITQAEIVQTYERQFTTYKYNKSKIGAGCLKNSDVLTSIDGKYVYFATKSGFAYLSMQEFISSTEQSLTVLSDDIDTVFSNYNDGPIKLHAFDTYVLLYKENYEKLLLLDTRNNAWYKWTVPIGINKIVKLDNEPKLILNNTICAFNYDGESYYDDITTKNKIPWYILSKRTHLNAPNDYKSINAINFGATFDKTDKFRFKTIGDDIIDSQSLGTIIEFNDKQYNLVEPVRRIKHNGFQYYLESYLDEFEQAPLSLSHITIKYKISGRIR